MKFLLCVVLAVAINFVSLSSAVEFRLQNTCSRTLYAKVKAFTNEGVTTVYPISKDASILTVVSLEPEFYGIMYADYCADDSESDLESQTQVRLTLGPIYTYYVSIENGYNLQVTVSPSPALGDDTYYCADAVFEVPDLAPSECLDLSYCMTYLKDLKDDIYVGGNGANATYSCKAEANFDVTFSCAQLILP